VTALRAAFYLMAEPVGDCLAAREGSFIAWCKRVMAERAQAQGNEVKSRAPAEGGGGRITAESWRNLSDYEVLQVANHGNLKSTRTLAKRELARRGIETEHGSVGDKIGLVRKNPGGGEFPAGMEGTPVFGGKYLLVDEGIKTFPNLGTVHSFIAHGKRGASYGCMVYADGRFHWVNLGRGAFGTVPFDLAQVSPIRFESVIP
jgi:hypothetical protein